MGFERNRDRLHDLEVDGSYRLRVEIEDVATTAKTFPDFAGFWAGLL